MGNSIKGFRAIKKRDEDIQTIFCEMIYSAFQNEERVQSARALFKAKLQNITCKKRFNFYINGFICGEISIGDQIFCLLYQSCCYIRGRYKRGN